MASDNVEHIIFQGLENLQFEAGRIASQHGFSFYDTFPGADKGSLEERRQLLTSYVSMKLMLIVGEAAEAQEELRNGGSLNGVYYTKDGEETQDPGSLEEPNKPEGFASELADIVIRVSSLAADLDIDLTNMILKKMRYNDTRSFRHGKEF